jgi:hypothetical protein
MMRVRRSYPGNPNLTKKKKEIEMAKAPVTATPDGKNIQLKLTNVTLAFVDIWEPIEGTTEDGRPNGSFGVSTSILLDKESDWGKAQIAAVRMAMKDARAAEWGENAPVIPASCLCLQDGEPIDPSTVDEAIPGSGERKERWAGFAGKFYISAKKPLKAKTKEDAIRELAAKHPVQILGPRKTAVDDRGNPCFPTLKETDDLIYSGAVCDVIIQIYPYNGTGKKPGGGNHPNRINASLESIKFVEHGTRLGGGKRVDAQSAFDEEEGEDDAVSPGAGAPAADPLDMLG